MAIVYEVDGTTLIEQFEVSGFVHPDASYEPEELVFNVADVSQSQVVRFRAERVGVEVKVTEVTSSRRAVQAGIEPDGLGVRVTIHPDLMAADATNFGVAVKVTGFDHSWLTIPVRVSRTDTKLGGAR